MKKSKKKQKSNTIVVEIKIRNPLVSAVMKKGVKKHKNKKREAKSQPI